jgi:hypothetical protein
MRKQARANQRSDVGTSWFFAQLEMGPARGSQHPFDSNWCFTFSVLATAYQYDGPSSYDK